MKYAVAIIILCLCVVSVKLNMRTEENYFGDWQDEEGAQPALKAYEVIGDTVKFYKNGIMVGAGAATEGDVAWFPYPLKVDNGIVLGMRNGATVISIYYEDKNGMRVEEVVK